MALFTKQDFTAPILSRKWLAIKFRPNMLLYSREHIISILESGLLFREDSVEVEQETPSAEDVLRIAGGGAGRWLSRGERITSVSAVTACIFTFPPRSFQKSALLNILAYMSVPVAVRALHRWLAERHRLRRLLARMRDYLALARRSAACLKECAALRTQLGSVSSMVESMHKMLCRQQSSLSILMSRASSALLGNAPWLRGDVAWEAVATVEDGDNLMKIHHAFLVVQSTLLKHIAMAHYIPSSYAQGIYKNHNERVYWIHTVLIEHLNEEFKANYESLERMYRLLKNFGNSDANVTKKPGAAIQDSWLYSEVHSDIAKTCMDLKLTLNKCIDLDQFMDSCALNNKEFDVVALNKDLDGLIEDLTKTLTCAQSAQIKLKKVQNKFKIDTKQTNLCNTQEKEVDEDSGKVILRIEEKEPETSDQVFYFMKTDDDDKVAVPVGDITTGPGEKERETTKVVLSELKRKLVKREDVMRERERQALKKTMPELKDNIPEFPRQINIEEVAERRGFIKKIRKTVPNRLFKIYKIQRIKSKKNKMYELKMRIYDKECHIHGDCYEINAKLSLTSKIITIAAVNKKIYVTKWFKIVNNDSEIFDKSNSYSDDMADEASSGSNNKINTNVSNHNEYKFSKKDLELSPSSSESDFELYNKENVALLNDIRRHRVARKKNYPAKRGSLTIDNVDESLKPIEYSFGTGMAIASVLQVNTKARLPNMAAEEVFIGDGEVSNDSGNDDDA